MAENKEEEEILEEKPQEEEETLKEETSIEEQGTLEKPEKGFSELEKKVRERTDQFYRRTMKAEEESKLAKEELAKSKQGKPSEIPSNIFDLAKTVSALREYSPEELDFIQMMSKAKSISPEEAAKTEEAKLYISARRQKVEAEKSIPEPSTKQSLSKKPIEQITPADVSAMSLKEKEEYFTAMGLIKKPRPFGGR